MNSKVVLFLVFYPRFSDNNIFSYTYLSDFDNNSRPDIHKRIKNYRNTPQSQRTISRSLQSFNSEDQSFSNSSNFPTNEIEYPISLSNVPIGILQGDEASSDDKKPRCDKICVRKCCQAKQFIDEVGICTDTFQGMQEWQPELRVSNYTLLYGYPNYPNISHCAIYFESKGEFALETTGNIYSINHKLEFGSHLYCIDKQRYEGEIMTVAYICYNKKLPKFLIVLRYFYMAGLCITCFLTGLILVLQFGLFKIRDLQDKCLTCLCICLLCSFTISLLNLTPLPKLGIDFVCISLGILQQFFLLALYFWVTVLCYEVMRIISGTVEAIPMLYLQEPGRRFLKYSFISWGIPLTISLLTLMMHTLQGSSSLEPFYFPNINKGRCFIKEEFWTLVIYLYAVQITLHCCSLFFMCRCLLLLHRAGAVLLPCLNRRNRLPPTAHNRSNLKMFWNQFSIFLLFVIIWTTDSVSIIYKRNIIWKFVKMVWTLQGILLLVLVLYSSNKWKQLKNALAKVLQCLAPFTDRISPRSSISRSTGDTNV